MNKPYCTKKH